VSGCSQSDDVHNCGACGNDCAALPHVNPGTASCHVGKCSYTCLAGYDDCGKSAKGCVDSLSANGNCGACGVTCSAPTALCSATGCSPDCTGTTPDQCGLTCTDTRVDPENCGSCGQACPSAASGAATCDGGKCGCRKGYASCGGACVNTMTDKFNCGGCGNECVVKCGAGSCVNPVAIRAAQRDSFALLSDGTVEGWGYNGQGELGNGTTTNAAAPTAVGVKGVISLGVAGDHACAVLSEGTAACWGNNYYGQVGNGSTGAQNAAPPTAVVGLTGVTGVAAGSDGIGAHSCAVLSDGALYCWGGASQGGCYLGGNSCGTPKLVPGLSGVTSVIAGIGYSCTLMSDGSVRCWGNNKTGQSSTSPVQVASLSGGVSSLSGSDENSLLYNGNHACAVLGDGTLKCWGMNIYGELGSGPAAGSSTALTVPGLTGVTMAACGGAHTCALLSNGTVECWGDNSRGQLGDAALSGGPGSTPTAVPGLTNAVAVAAGGEHTCALLASGVVKCWGSDQDGQLGDGNTGSKSHPRPVTVSW
jgi:alpha-tubulin suppressor-like RCC1 family protein